MIEFFHTLYIRAAAALVGDYNKAIGDVRLLAHKTRVGVAQAKATALKAEASALAEVNKVRRAALVALVTEYDKVEAEIDGLVARL